MRKPRLELILALTAAALLGAMTSTVEAEECPRICSTEWVSCADCAQDALAVCLQDVDDRVISGELSQAEADQEYATCWRYYYDEMDTCDRIYDECCSDIGPEPPFN
jgi:hypothetical protein